MSDCCAIFSFLLQLLEEKRHLEVVRASIPNKRRLDNELVEHQIQV